VFARVFTPIEQLKVEAYLVFKPVEHDFGDDGTEAISVPKRNGVRLIEEEQLVSQAFQPKEENKCANYLLVGCFCCGSVIWL
jgi:hypothetical protein